MAKSSLPERLRTRAEVANGAYAVTLGGLPFSQFEASVDDQLRTDPLVEELLDALQHEPRVGGILSSTSSADHSRYMERVYDLINALRQN